MTACESSGYTGASFLYHSRHIIHRFLEVVVVGVSNLISNIPGFSRCQNDFLSPSTDAGAGFFGGFDQKEAPSPSLFSLSLTLICISPHIGKLLSARAKAVFLAVGCP